MHFKTSKTKVLQMVGELEMGKFENFENIQLLKKKFETKLIFEKKIRKKPKI